MFIKKMDFRFFERLVRICFQSLEKMLIRAKKFFSPKIQYGYKKAQNFMQNSNSLKKFKKI
jgi:hypothetical protein